MLVLNYRLLLNIIVYATYGSGIEIIKFDSTDAGTDENKILLKGVYKNGL